MRTQPIIHIYTPSFFPKLVGMSYASHGHAELLSELGADVTVIASDSESASDFSYKKLPYKTAFFPIYGTGLPWNKIRGNPETLIAFTAQERPDLIIAEGWFTWGSELLPTLRTFSRHAILSSHGSADKTIQNLSPSTILRSLTYKYIEAFALKKIYKALSAAIVLSEIDSPERFADIPKFRENKVPLYVAPNFSIYNPEHTSRLLPLKKRLLHIGEMLPHKNQLLGIKLLSLLPEDYSLELVFPKETAYYACVREAARRANVTGRVFYTIGKTRDELEPHFSGASALLILSPAKDTQPIVAVDGLCKALPFVSTPVGCMPEMRGGIISSPSRMADSIIQLHQSDTYAQHSRNALNFYTKNYSRTHAKEVLNSLITDLAL